MYVRMYLCVCLSMLCDNNCNCCTLKNNNKKNASAIVLCDIMMSHVTAITIGNGPEEI